MRLTPQPTPCPSFTGKSDAANRWKRGGVLVGQIAGSPSCNGGSGGGDGRNVKGSDPKSAGPIGTDGPVEGGPTIHEDGSTTDGAPPKEAPQKTKSEGMVGDVPGAQEDGKIDNVKSIAKSNQHGLRMIEWWTRGSAAQDLSKTMEAAYWLEMVDKKRESRVSTHICRRSSPSDPCLCPRRPLRLQP